jgi:arylsulfatase A-like enzyme
MFEPSARRRLSLLGLAWLALSAIHVVIQLLVPRGVVTDSLLPVWARASLLATELVALALLIAVWALPLLLIGERIPPAGRVALRSTAGWLVLLGLAASWSSFWLSGQFLDRQGLRFAATNFASMADYALRVHPFLFCGMPFLLLALSAATCGGAPGWCRVLSSRVESFVLGAALAGVASAAVAVIGGEVGHRFLKQAISDPATGLSYPGPDLYRLRRDRSAGPLAHLVFTAFAADPFEDDAAAAAPDLVRRPIVSMEQYLAGVDRDRVKRWNVIVVLIDSLRADQLRATGGAREVMPALETLATAGRVFSDCVSQASHTDYAAPAVFSSHYPLRSRDLYRYPKNPPYPRVLIYDVLHALGWRTALFSSQNEEWGQMIHYLQTGGLDVLFHSRSKAAEEVTRDRPAFAGTIDDSVTLSESLKWIEQAPDAPFFLYLNLQNSHLPYDVPADFPRRFAPREIDAKISIGWYPRERTELVKNVYADSLAYVDVQLGRLFARLKERGLWDRTLVVVSGDHGEAFYEHGSAAHANGVYDEVMRVPLVIRAPGLEPGRDARPAQLLDVAPGVFHLLGLPVHPSFQGDDPFLPDAPADRARYVICDSPWKTHLAVYRAGFKLIRDGDLGASILYDLSRDPEEKVDATAAHPEVARDLRARLAAWRRAQLEYYENSPRQTCEYPPRLR